MHPLEVVHLEHDGKVFLVDEQGNGPQLPIPVSYTHLTLPTTD